MTPRLRRLQAGIICGALSMVSPVAAQDASQGSSMMMQSGHMPHRMMSPGLIVPTMNPSNGRKLFAEKGCVVCHSINGVGGDDAAALDASTMPPMMNPFEFTAQMWAGAAAMIEMQKQELGEQIQFTGQELADIIAFVHDADEQKKLSEADIPPKIKKLMHSDTEGGHEMNQMKQGGEMNMNDGQSPQ
ncbi:c-type cytochrome [Mesorhizobium sp. VK24D]|uniref:C-type cytochrome n=1 Tax=Mesorhizobium album TaxID=3072314 RepID=A0ABU4Y7H3_9HYPH|nr:c-type cytochrome [Mesorhizobium sp. VK24D]MDX8482880.1 c-type cytochrome [Mesorhizobium sp. VK24D]